MEAAKGAPGEESVELSVVLVNWNARDELLRCLASLAEGAISTPHEVIVVDNCSSDGSITALRQSHYSVRIVASQENVGFGAGARLGAAVARGGLLAVANPDLTFCRCALDLAVDYHRSHPEVGVVGPAHFNEHGVCTSRAERRLGALSAVRDAPLLSRMLSRSSEVGASEDAVLCDWVRGACLIFKSEALAAIGGFPADTFLYGEELLVGHRMRRQGWAVAYLPAARIVHAKGVSVDQLWSQSDTLLRRREARIVVMREILGGARFLIWNLLSVLGLGVQVLSSRASRPTRSTTRALLRLHLRALSRCLG